MQKIRKAVFPVAGFGTRFLPATKAMPKELLPIINKPLIQYAVEEAISAGIDTLIFITGRNKRAIEDHFDSNPELEVALHLKGNTEQAEMVRNILPAGVECIFVRQPKQLGLGHAVLCAERAVGNEPFAVLLPDVVVTEKENNTTNYLKEMISLFESSGNGQVMLEEVPKDNTGSYGIAKFENIENQSISYIHEKPAPDEAPSNYAVAGRYVLPAAIWPLLNTPPDINNEMQLTDAINYLIEGGNKLNSFSSMKYEVFDCGSTLGYMKANLELGLRDQEIGVSFKEHIKTILKGS